MTEQPTHHGYAVNVKDNGRWDLERGTLTDDEVQALYDRRAEDFWLLVQDVAVVHGFRGCYSEGRSGGWAQPFPQPATDDMWEHEVTAWVDQTFRPFERDVLALVALCQEDFRDDLADAVTRAAAEPAERAYWEACDTITID